jgi:hypothetical protein
VKVSIWPYDRSAPKHGRDGTYKFIGFGDIHGPQTYKFIGLGDIQGPKPYKFIGLGDIQGPKPYKFIEVW